jgi:hypothetical protein
VDSLPDDMPEPRGLEISINYFVDADHATDKVTRRSQIGVLIFINKAPISWYSKKLSTVETFGSEFVAAVGPANVFIL